MSRTFTPLEFADLYRLQNENNELKAEREKLLNSNVKLYENLISVKQELAEYKMMCKFEFKKEPNFVNFLTDEEKAEFKELRHRALGRAYYAKKKSEKDYTDE